MPKKTETKKGKEGGGKKSCAIQLNELGLRETNSLLYYIVKCRISDRNEKGDVLSYEEVAHRVKEWARDNVRKEAYNDKGNIPSNWVGRLMPKAIRRGYVKLGRYVEQSLVDEIRKYLTPPYPDIVIAPDKDDLLRYVWEDLDNLLIQAVEGSNGKTILGFSGGRTMLALARSLSELSNLKMSRLSPEMKEKIIACSLTSGGSPSDIAALSDAVVGTIATALGVNARGLLGPSWFDDEKVLAAFRAQRHVEEHKVLVDSADFIVTSVGYLGDPKALMAHALKKLHQGQFLAKHPGLCDILYHPYHGISGETIKLPPKAKIHLFSVVDINKLRAMVSEGKPCLVVAWGREKGLHALPGIFKQQMANYVYMDKECAEGLLEALQ
jgi:DNA-binding transcriptional regulator LsrR (DeoR family)